MNLILSRKAFAILEDALVAYKRHPEVTKEEKELIEDMRSKVVDRLNAEQKKKNKVKK